MKVNKEEPKCNQALQREGDQDEQIFRAIPSPNPIEPWFCLVL